MTAYATDDPAVRAASVSIIRTALDRKRAREAAEAKGVGAADPPEAA